MPAIVSRPGRLSPTGASGSCSCRRKSRYDRPRGKHLSSSGAQPPAVARPPNHTRRSRVTGACSRVARWRREAWRPVHSACKTRCLPVAHFLGPCHRLRAGGASQPSSPAARPISGTGAPRRGVRFWSWEQHRHGCSCRRSAVPWSNRRRHSRERSRQTPVATSRRCSGSQRRVAGVSRPWLRSWAAGSR